ncbi:SDR family NAD(P)-dependent oxidoreductase [Leucothrix arctica]|uniref:Capsule biosynthesis protein CapD n=1 Tax=Leucothrix arctica TaxID=1481894 RepID=A0A317CCR7_9GAMM|nr:SDR family NAD(P)-dependent oxidoreductase [Leucothrix arctica]PWQ94100.1 capsule biosynthesis protein CapD [Leucothrix arctica]
MTASILNRLPTLLDDASPPKLIMVAGASGGIGYAFCQQVAMQYPDAKLIRLARSPKSLAKLSIETQDLAFDLADEKSIQSAIARLPEKVEVDWLFIATGWLHDDSHQPEKTYRTLNSEQMSHSFQLNTIGPTLLVKTLLERVKLKHALKIGILTARVGSISDNRLGGWHSYRASKAALNMLIKNFSIELERMKKPVVIVGLQPGTTDTDLSAPFQRGVAPEDLQSPSYTANQLLKVMQVIDESDSGSLYDFLGIAFEP